MKKYIYMITCILFIIFLSSICYCFGQYDMTGDFLEIINSNLIDASYQSELDNMFKVNWNNGDWVDLEGKYIKIWSNELDSIYKKLMTILSQAEKEMLQKSQKG